MRILILANNDVGLFKFRKELLERLLTENQVFIALPEGECIPAMVEMGCEFIPTDVDRRGTNPIRDMKLFRGYLDLIKKVQPDVVLTYTIKPNIYGGMACRVKKIPYITNITGLGTTFERGGMVEKLVTAMYKIALKQSHCVFFQNAYNRQILEQKGIQGLKTRIVSGSGVNLEQHVAEPYRTEGKPEFLYVGRIMKEKGIDELFATAKVYHDRADFSILGYTEESYEEQLKELTEQGIIRYFGFDTKVHPYFTHASAIVMPSYHEGMSNVILEAAATARPVLASNINGCKEAVEDSRTGYLFDAKSTSSLMSAVEQFLALSEQERIDMGLRGRAKMEEEFDRQKVVNAYVEEIERVKEKEG